jgi:hypothetical protein
MGERETDNLEALVVDKTTIEHNRRFAVAPGREDLTDQRIIEGAGLNPWVTQPAPNAGNPSCGLRWPGNVGREIAQMDGSGLE